MMDDMQVIIEIERPENPGVLDDRSALLRFGRGSMLAKERSIARLAPG